MTTFTPRINVNELSRTDRAAIVRCLVEGNSIRSTSRITGAARNMVTTLILNLGPATSAYLDRELRGLSSWRVECDEIWAICYAKARNVPEDKRDEFGFGEVRTWVALDPDTKLVPAWLVGRRDADDAKAFAADLAPRLLNWIQITTDGHQPHVAAIRQRR